MSGSPACPLVSTQRAAQPHSTAELPLSAGPPLQQLCLVGGPSSEGACRGRGSLCEPVPPTALVWPVIVGWVGFKLLAVPAAVRVCRRLSSCGACATVLDQSQPACSTCSITLSASASLTTASRAGCRGHLSQVLVHVTRLLLDAISSVHMMPGLCERGRHRCSGHCAKHRDRAAQGLLLTARAL